jgi:ABC-type nitrate/sulfonate/bicarbonate transport system substrate-binding protein
MPVGDPGTMLASLKNKVIDAAMAVEPTQTAAVQALKFAKTMVDIEGGGGPSVFHPYAYNGVFVHSAFLKDHPDTARAIVTAIVEACAVINDPTRMNDLMDVAANYMKGSDPEVVKAYLTKYRSNYGAVASRQGVDNVSAMLVAAKIIEKAVPYEQLVATDFMPPEAGAPTR